MLEYLSQTYFDQYFCRLFQPEFILYFFAFVLPTHYCSYFCQPLDFWILYSERFSIQVFSIDVE